MQIVKNVINIGIDEPFTFLHATDTHITCTDRFDSLERKMLANERKNGLFSNSQENIEFLRKYVADTGYQLIHTGDLMDFITPENLRVAKKFAADTDLLMIAGNHELHHCPNNVFCEADFTEDLKIRTQSLNDVQKSFKNDIRFFCKEINGVNLVGINNSDYQISEEHFKTLKDIVAIGKPILLFMHIPLYSDELYKFQKGAMLAAPDKVVSGYTAFQVFEQKADKVTQQAYEYIHKQPLIKCVISGHVHNNFEIQNPTEVKQLITGLDTLREIIVK